MPRYGVFLVLDSEEFHRKVFELEGAFCIQRRGDRIDFSEGTPTSLSGSGKVFNQSEELRWDNGHYAMLWEVEETTGLPQPARIFYCDTRPFHLLVWQEPARRIALPAAASQIIALKYLKDGVLRFLRFAGVR